MRASGSFVNPRVTGKLYLLYVICKYDYYVTKQIIICMDASFVICVILVCLEHFILKTMRDLTVLKRQPYKILRWIRSVTNIF